MCIKVTTDDGSVISRQVQLDVVTPEALILGKEEYHIQQVLGVMHNRCTFGSTFAVLVYTVPPIY